jgi:sialate O-acetylesterase
MRHLTIRSLAVLAALAAAPLSVQAQPRPLLFADPFTDNALFQRDRPIAIWGRALPGETVTIDFAGRRTTARTDSNGRWSAELPALAAGGPHELVASTRAGGRETLRNILVGDVWLCSGQSNMEMGVNRALNGPGEVGSANDPQIRLMTVGHDTALTPVESFRTPVSWQPATPGTVADFSAACYFMARELRATQKVPIGLIDASWGGTAIDAWRSEAGIERAGGLGDKLEVLRAYRTDPAQGNRRWGALWERWWREKSGDRPGSEPWQPAAGGADWKPVPRMTNWEGWGDPALANYNGLMWYRTSVTLTPEQAAQAGTLDIGWADDLDQTWVNGVPVGNTYGPNASRAYALPKGLLKAGENVIVVSVLDTYAAGGLSGPEELRVLKLANGTSVPLGTNWSYRTAPGSFGWPPRAPWESVAGLSLIYNGMVAPLGRYGLRGVAWYQGESDAGLARGYAAKLGSMMTDWRGQFRSPDLPFLIVQLAGWGPSPAAPVESGSAVVRDEQRIAAERDPNAALAVAIDLGDRADIHPANKQDVGRRLARAARHLAYKEAITPSGPEPAGARLSGDTVTVEFKNIDGQLLAYSANVATGFELCGDAQGSCRFVPGIVQGSSVTLPVGGGAASRVRFCWGDSPVCNLYDGAGLPAGPFELRVAR